MAIYAIVEVEVTNPEGYKDYTQLVGPTLDKYGGKFVVRGGEIETVEGDWHPKRIVILEFASKENFRRWYDSPEYVEARELRFKNANSKMILVHSYVPA